MIILAKYAGYMLYAVCLPEITSDMKTIYFD